MKIQYEVNVKNFYFDCRSKYMEELKKIIFVYNIKWFLFFACIHEFNNVIKCFNRIVIEIVKLMFLEFNQLKFLQLEVYNITMYLKNKLFYLTINKFLLEVLFG